MLDIPGASFLDKASLVGGCVRLALAVDARRLRDEVRGLPADVWGSPGGRVGVHRAAEALFLRGHAPAEGDLPVTDRPVLDRLPYIRWLIETMLEAPPLRCLLARLPADTVIAPHVDRPPYFAKTLRVHIPVETNESVYMVADGLSYSMADGEVWVLNNSAVHAVWNAHPTRARTHLICDCLPSPSLLGRLAQGERGLGVSRPFVEHRLRESTVPKVAAGG
jgi:hypothetical protein